ncbi:fimbrial protein [Escherichia albertii]|uniref:fimbrial protein n=1 Tax=Escherichia albertii TaxID=208962 RepID=UPI00074326B2|nr:fimbrial protein [Escherichia albertii]AUS67476.1 fimbrial protein [Escherichia albertii]EAB1453149.1 fimbrial protein [Escherichia albertii]EEW7342083.1 fimbrial protein [Escherichia albertii]EJI9011168.1 fimbrial protein [Escherichia albertii]EJQ6148018.1 fimbrial protein [Escherichia albertii]
MSNKITLFLLCGILGGFSGNALAAGVWGPCKPADNGTTYNYNVVVDVGIPDAKKNVANTVLPDVMNWSNGTKVSLECECPTPDSYTKEKDTLIQGVSAISIKTRQVSGFQYYRLTDQLEVASKIRISAGMYGFVPFKNQQALEVTGCNKKITTPYMGGAGLLSFVVTKPFIGDADIPWTSIALLYASKTNQNYGDVAISSVSIEGTVTITQGCEVKPGTVLDVPFGEFPASAFKNGKGQMPEGGTKKEINLGFDCNNISDGIKVSLRLEGATNAADSRAVDMGDPNIGVLVTDTAGNVLKPNDTNSTTLLTLSALDSTTHRNAAIQLFASPVSTTNSLPEAGTFEGVTTVLLDME